MREKGLLPRKMARSGACVTGWVALPFIQTGDAEQNQSRQWGGGGRSRLNHRCILNVLGLRDQKKSVVYRKAWNRETFLVTIFARLMGADIRWSHGCE